MMNAMKDEASGALPLGAAGQKASDTGNPMGACGLHHVALIASDYPRSKAFYTHTLGCTVIAEEYRAARDSWKLDLAIPGGGQLELFSFPSPPQRVSRPEACGLRHLAIAVQAVEAARTYLASQGVVCEEIRLDEMTGKRFFFFADPDGLPLEIYQV